MTSVILSLLIVLVIVIGEEIYQKFQSYRRRLNRVSRPIVPPPPPRTRQPSQEDIEGIIWSDLSESDAANQFEWVEAEINDYGNSRDSQNVQYHNVLTETIPDDLDNILTDVIGSRDPYSQEIFIPGQTVYFCRLHRLAHHEDSWKEMDCKCRDCGNAKHTRQYQLPSEIEA